MSDLENTSNPNNPNQNDRRGSSQSGYQSDPSNQSYQPHGQAYGQPYGSSQPSRGLIPPGQSGWNPNQPYPRQQASRPNQPRSSTEIWNSPRSPQLVSGLNHTLDPTRQLDSNTSRQPTRRQSQNPRSAKELYNDEIDKMDTVIKQRFVREDFGPGHGHVKMRKVIPFVVGELTKALDENTRLKIELTKELDDNEGMRIELHNALVENERLKRESKK